MTIGLRRDGRFDVWRHLKTGGLYLVTHSHVMDESAKNPFESFYVVYVSLSDGRTWYRPRREFHDGRFEQCKIPVEEPGFSDTYLDFVEDIVDPVYNADVPDYGDVMTVADWVSYCESGGFIDYDGHGNPAQAYEDGIRMAGDWVVYPSTRGEIPASATHIVWYNR